jgi:hypothetical protein
VNILRYAVVHDEKKHDVRFRAQIPCEPHQTDLPIKPFSMTRRLEQRKMLQSTWLMSKGKKREYLRYDVVCDEKKHDVRF